MYSFWVCGSAQLSLAWQRASTLKTSILAQSLVQQQMRRLLVICARAIKSEVRRRTVQLAPLLQQAIEGLSGILRLQQRSPAAANGPLEENVGTRVQPGHHAYAFEGLAIGGAKNDAAAGRKNDAVDAHQPLERLLLDLAIVGLAAGGENLRDIPVLAPDDEFVGIHKTMPCQRGKATDHRGFPASHKSDEHEIGQHALKFSQHSSLVNPFDLRKVHIRPPRPPSRF